MPYGLALFMKRSDSAPKEFFIALSGPLFNLLMALIFKSGPFFEANMAILLVNLIPIFPLDGGRILFVLLSYKNPFFALSFMRKSSFILGAILFFIAVFQAFYTGFNFSLFIICAFLFTSTLNSKEKQKLYLTLFKNEEEKYRKIIRCIDLSSPKKSKAINVACELSPYFYSFINVLDDNGYPIKRISEAELKEALIKKGTLINLSEIIENS